MEPDDELRALKWELMTFRDMWGEAYDSPVELGITPSRSHPIQRGFFHENKSSKIIKKQASQAAEHGQKPFWYEDAERSNESCWCRCFNRLLGR